MIGEGMLLLLGFVMANYSTLEFLATRAPAQQPLDMHRLVTAQGKWALLSSVMLGSIFSAIYYFLLAPLDLRYLSLWVLGASGAGLKALEPVFFAAFTNLPKPWALPHHINADCAALNLINAVILVGGVFMLSNNNGYGRALFNCGLVALAFTGLLVIWSNFQGKLRQINNLKRLPEPALQLAIAGIVTLASMGFFALG